MHGSETLLGKETRAKVKQQGEECEARRREREQPQPGPLLATPHIHRDLVTGRVPRASRRGADLRLGHADADRCGRGACVVRPPSSLGSRARVTPSRRCSRRHDQATHSHARRGRGRASDRRWGASVTARRKGERANRGCERGADSPISPSPAVARTSRSPRSTRTSLSRASSSLALSPAYAQETHPVDRSTAMPPVDSPSAGSSSNARHNAAPYPRRTSSSGGDTYGQSNNNPSSRTRSASMSIRHLSCENCRVRKMKCSRQSPCLSCRLRGDQCIWVGQAPNGSADEDELERSQDEVNRLKKLVDLLLARLEEQDDAEQQLEFYQQSVQQDQQGQQQQHHQPSPPSHAQHERPQTQQRSSGDAVLVDGPPQPSHAQRSPRQSPSHSHSQQQQQHRNGGDSGYAHLLPGTGSPRYDAPRSNGHRDRNEDRDRTREGDIPITPLHGPSPHSHYARLPAPSGFTHGGVQYVAVPGPPGSPSLGPGPGHPQHAPGAFGDGHLHHGGGAPTGRGGHVLPPGARIVYGPPRGEEWRSG
ncbi:hypothetical protein DMC30DRAFT_82161 [Rhodotorula diobovata]|uniref:Zn(2)-C6 fungal-type domain-containing protein n=1 Tax=Rhodotorula diobovata TaxID=5288 RepID=A0A5C5FMA9_9BASI|nr:hypothetical protein DMC30DRAFT_82161 [Rhodotorula diobovata]